MFSSPKKRGKEYLAYSGSLQTVVDVEDYMNAQPDAIAHSASKIISRLKAGGEKTIQALKSLCWRCKGIQVEVIHKLGVVISQFFNPVVKWWHIMFRLARSE